LKVVVADKSPSTAKTKTIRAKNFFSELMALAGSGGRRGTDEACASGRSLPTARSPR
jgi:hypothetical protein